MQESMRLKLQGHHLPGLPDVEEVVVAARRELAPGGRPLEAAHFPRVACPSVRVVKNRGSRRNGAALFPEMGVLAPPCPFFKKV